MGVCEEICVPAELALTATLEGPGASDPGIHAAMAARPVPGARAGVQSVRCIFEPIADGLRLTARIEMPRLAGEIAVVEAGNPRVWVSDADTQREGRVLTAVADFVPPLGEPLAISRDAIRFTVLGAAQAVDIRGCAD